MTIKCCVVCDGDFVARASAKTCSGKCSKDLKAERTPKHQAKYRAANSEKIRERGRNQSAKQTAAVQFLKTLIVSPDHFDEKRAKRCERGRRRRSKEREKRRVDSQKRRAMSPEKTREQTRAAAAKRREAFNIIKQLNNGVIS